MHQLFKAMLPVFLVLSGAFLVILSRIYRKINLCKLRLQQLLISFPRKPRLTQLQPLIISNSNLVPVYTYRLLKVYPNDPNPLTEDLVYENGFLYEGTGLNGRSSLHRVELETGKILQIRTLQGQFFGEGVTIYGNKIIR